MLFAVMGSFNSAVRMGVTAIVVRTEGRLPRYMAVYLYLVELR
jgi:hypothetical protein